MTITKAWDHVWNSLSQVGVCSVQGNWQPTDLDCDVNFGKAIADNIDALQETKLSITQILLISDLVYNVGRAGQVTQHLP